jgi:hypothetical protein
MNRNRPLVYWMIGPITKLDHVGNEEDVVSTSRLINMVCPNPANAASETAKKHEKHQLSREAKFQHWIKRSSSFLFCTLEGRRFSADGELWIYRVQSRAV